MAVPRPIGQESQPTDFPSAGVVAELELFDAQAVGALLHRGARYAPTMVATDRARRRKEWRDALPRARAG